MGAILLAPCNLLFWFSNCLFMLPSSSTVRKGCGLPELQATAHNELSMPYFDRSACEAII
eukprot:3485473-Amphidinium_carterae.3